MGRKKSQIVNRAQDKENLDLVQKKSDSREILTNPKTIDPSFTVGASKKQLTSLNNENNYLLMQEVHSTETSKDKSILCDSSNENNELDAHVEYMNTSQFDLTNQTNDVRKRHIEEISGAVADENIVTELGQLKKRCVDIEKRMDTLENMWIRMCLDHVHSFDGNLPSCLASADHLESVQNIFHDVVEDVNSNHHITNNKNQNGHLNITANNYAKVFTALKKDSSMATARNIVKHMYPEPPINSKLCDIDPILAAEIVRFAQENHPDDPSTKTQIRRAISNYFAVNRHRKNRKAIHSSADNQQL